MPEVDPPVYEPTLEQAYDTGSDAWLRAQDGARDDALPEDAPYEDAWDEVAPSPAVDDDDDDGERGRLPTWAAVPLEEERPADSGRGRRRAAPREGMSPLGAVAGALVAVAGVALGIGALLWARGDAPQGTPTVAAPPVATSPSLTPSATAEPTPSATTPVVPTATTSAPAVTPSASPVTAPTRPAVTVLNNSRRTNLAARAAERFADGGWTIRQTGNFTGRVAQSTVYYLPGQEAAARAFARQFAIPRVLPRFERLPGQGFTVVLTRDYDA